MFKSVPPAIAVVCLLVTSNLAGQQISSVPASATEAQLRLVSPHHDPVTVTATELRAMAHITVTIHNSHSNADETYSGIRVAALLAKVGAPLGTSLRGPALAHYIVASGSDGYHTVVALGEVDPEFHPGEVLVADRMDGKPLDAHSGPLKLVISEDKHPARWVHNLVQIELKTVP